VSKGFHLNYSYCLKEEAKSYKMQRPWTISIITYTANIGVVVKILGRKKKKKMEAVFVKAHFGFRGGKETGMQM
jgi:hypothetical protein